MNNKIKNNLLQNTKYFHFIQNMWDSWQYCTIVYVVICIMLVFKFVDFNSKQFFSVWNICFILQHPFHFYKKFLFHQQGINFQILGYMFISIVPRVGCEVSILFWFIVTCPFIDVLKLTCNMASILCLQEFAKWYVIIFWYNMKSDFVLIYFH